MTRFTTPGAARRCRTEKPPLGTNRISIVRGSGFRVQGSRFRVHHKHPEYNSPLPPPSGWSGGILVPPWTYPGTIDHLPDHLFDQARLFKSDPSGVSSLYRCSGLDVGCWMLDVGCWGPFNVIPGERRPDGR